jgi:hypothetical protein
MIAIADKIEDISHREEWLGDWFDTYNKVNDNYKFSLIRIPYVAREELLKQTNLVVCIVETCSKFSQHVRGWSLL